MLLKLRTEITPLFNHPAFNNRLFRIAVALTYTAFLTLLLVQSSAQPIVGPVAPREFNLAWEIFLTTGHLVGFSLLVFLIWSALTTVAPSTRSLIVAVLFACLLGLITEILQTLVPDRSSSLFDLVCDWSVAFAVAYFIYRRSYIST